MKCHDAILNHKECFRLVKSIRNPKKLEKFIGKLLEFSVVNGLCRTKRKEQFEIISAIFFSLVLFLIKIDFHIEVDAYFQHVFSFMF